MSSDMPRTRESTKLFIERLFKFLPYSVFENHVIIKEESDNDKDYLIHTTNKNCPLYKSLLKKIKDTKEHRYIKSF